jgi:hypothetical protein
MYHPVRAWLAEKFLSVASRIIPVQVEENEDNDGGLPAGHPVVVRSTEAERMVREGSSFAMAARQVPEPPAPAPRGSLRDRIERARKNA